MRRRRFDSDLIFRRSIVERQFLGIALAAAGIATAGGILGSIEQNKAQKKANDANESRYQQALSEHGRSFALSSGFINRADQLFGEQKTLLTDASEQSRGEIEKVGRAGRQNILEREEQTGANVRQTLTSRGLGNSTVLANAERGIAFDTNRAINELNEQIALLRSGNILSTAQLQSQALGQHADFLFRAGAFQSGLIQDKINTIVGRTDVANPNAGGIYRAIGQGAGAIGGLLGGLGGAGGGAGGGGFNEVLGPPAPI